MNRDEARQLVKDGRVTAKRVSEKERVFHGVKHIKESQHEYEDRMIDFSLAVTSNK